MHTDVLTPVAAKFFPNLSDFKGDFYLAGGTGLALQIGHRVSVDFDLFSSSPIKRTLLEKVERIFATASREILLSNRTELTIMVGGMKFTFLHYPFPVLLPFNASGPIPMLAARETLAAKAYTIGRRGELKDYVDIYCGLAGGHVSLGEIITLAQQKYGDAFNDRLFLEQLVYLDDVEDVEITMLSARIPSKKEMIEYFSELIQRESVVV